MSTKKTPFQLVKEAHKDKAGLVDAVRKLAAGDLWIDRVNDEKGLERISNAKLLRLLGVLTAVKDEFGSRKALVDAIVKIESREKDGDYKKRLEAFSIPKLWDCYRSAKRRTAAA